MPIITIGTNNLVVEMTTMEATLERLVKESEVKEAHITLERKRLLG